MVVMANVVKSLLFLVFVYFIYKTGIYVFIWDKVKKFMDKLLRLKSNIKISRREGFLRKKFMKKLLRNMKNNDEI